MMGEEVVRINALMEESRTLLAKYAPGTEWDDVVRRSRRTIHPNSAFIAEFADLVYHEWKRWYEDRGSAIAFLDPFQVEQLLRDYEENLRYFAPTMAARMTHLNMLAEIYNGG